jgi:hypothetical protein
MAVVSEVEEGKKLRVARAHLGPDNRAGFIRPQMAIVYVYVSYILSKCHLIAHRNGMNP